MKLTNENPGETCCKVSDCLRAEPLLSHPGPTPPDHAHHCLRHDQKKTAKAQHKPEPKTKLVGIDKNTESGLRGLGHSVFGSRVSGRRG